MSKSDCSMYVTKMQEKNVSPMPLIGLYVAAASLLCTIGMYLDILKKLQYWKKFQFNYSDKFFGLNAFYLTLLAVATKLTGDLTTPMRSPRDNVVKISSTAFFTLAICAFLTSLGPMNGKDILSNVAALGILVITALVNLGIQLSTGAIDYSIFPEIIVAMVLLFCAFITFVSTALAVPAIMKHAKSKYQTIHDIQLDGQQHTFEELRLSVTKYSVMAATSNPQYMVTRMVTFRIVYFILTLSALNSLSASLRAKQNNWFHDCPKHESDYKWSVSITFWVQSFTIMYFINPTYWLVIMPFTYGVFKVSKEESYWTEKLVEWRRKSIPRIIKRHKSKKLLYNIKALIITFCIQFQTMIVLCCKLCIMFLSIIAYPIGVLIYHLCNLKHENEVSNVESELAMDYNDYVILLEGEVQFPKILLREIINGVDEMIKEGRTQQPQKLFNLLSGSFSFSAVIEFDSNRVPSLLSNEPPNCWTLPVVTLTTIAIALPDIDKKLVDRLISSVDEGLRYAGLVDALDKKHKLESIKDAADDTWTSIYLHKKWLDLDLERLTGEVNSAKGILQALANEAEKTVREFESTGNRSLVENPLYWPANVLAANSMYRISQTILLYYENGECRAEELFGNLKCMIAGILTPCLVNLPHVIATKCSHNSFEERVESVNGAAILLGETEGILKHFEEHRLSSNDFPLCIDEWMVRQVPTVVLDSAASNGTPSAAESNKEHVVVQMQA